MLKELVKIANDLDLKGLRKEADCIDLILLKMAARSYTNGDLVDVKYNGKWYPAIIMGESHSRANTYRVSYVGYPPKWNEYIKLSGNSNDRIKPQGSEVEGSFWESAKEVLYNIPRNQWRNGVSQTLEAAEEEASEAVSAAAQAAFDAIIDNPSLVEWVSISAKIGGVITGIVGGAGTGGAGAAAGVAIIEGSAVIDFIAAYGYFKKGESLNGFFSLLSGLVLIPAGPALALYKAMLRFRQGPMALLKKMTPSLRRKVVLSLLAFVETLLILANEMADKGLALIEQTAPEIEDKEKVVHNMKNAGVEITAQLTTWKSDLESIAI